MSKVLKGIVTAKNVCKPVGPYSHAIATDKTLYVSGVLGLDAQSKLVPGGAVEEIRQVLENLKHILEAGASSLEAVVKVTVLLKNMDDYQAINQVYAEYFPENCPARVAYQVVKLPMNAAVEMDAIALIGDVHIEKFCPCP